MRPSGVSIPNSSINLIASPGEAVDFILHIAKENNSRKIKEILRVTSYNTHTNSYDITSL